MSYSEVNGVFGGMMLPEDKVEVINHSFAQSNPLDGIEFTDASCATTDTDATVTMGSTGMLQVGMAVSGTGIPAGATVAEITDGTTFELSAAATATTDPVTLTFTGSGASGWRLTGDGAPTLTLSGNPAYGTFTTTAGAGNYGQIQYVNGSGGYAGAAVVGSGALAFVWRVRLASLTGGITNATNTALEGCKFFVGYASDDTDVLNTSSIGRYVGFFKDDEAGDASQSIRLLAGTDVSGSIEDHTDVATGWTGQWADVDKRATSATGTRLRRADKIVGTLDWTSFGIRLEPQFPDDLSVSAVTGMRIRGFINGEEVVNRLEVGASRYPSAGGTMAPVLAFERDDSESMLLTFMPPVYRYVYGLS